MNDERKTYKSRKEKKRKENIETGRGKKTRQKEIMNNGKEFYKRKEKEWKYRKD